MAKTDWRERADDEWMTAGEVAELFQVDAKTASRWAPAGKIPDTDRYGRGTMRTPGGHIRFRVGTMRAIERGELALTYGRHGTEAHPVPAH